MPELKTYSVLIAWQDNDPEQGEFGATVRAVDSEEAERMARAEMRASYVSEMGDDDDAEEMADDRENEDGEFGGRLIDCHEGAIWMADKMEKALRDILASADANDGSSLMNAIEAAREIIAEVDRP